MAQITEAKLIASDGGDYDSFGTSVSISGDYALVGAVDNTKTGSAYVFHFDGFNWVEQTKLQGEPGDWFGNSVSLSGNYALVGAPYDDDNGFDAGSAHIFHFDGSTWVHQTKLLSSDGTIDDRFGISVSLSGDYALVGAYGDDDNGSFAGSAYIFHRDGLNWVEQAKLLPSDNDFSDFFGYSVSLDGDYALVGAYGAIAYSGSAYIFQFNGSNWVEQSKLVASDAEIYDYFGYSVSLSGEHALIGVFGDGTFGGAAYAYHLSGSDWEEQPKLIPSDRAANDDFGTSVSISGNYALVGADGDNSLSGSAYIFHFNGSNWVEQVKLTASDGTHFDYFGRSVSLSGNHALAGASGHGTHTGAAYVYSGFATPSDPFAQYGICYGSTGIADQTNPGALVTINPLTGDGTLVGPTGIIGDNGPSVPAIAIKSTGEICGVSSSSNSGLYTINASTGAGTFVASTGLSLPNAMVFDSHDQLYIADGSNNLYTLDETTGSSTLIGPLGFNVRGIAFDPTDGTMYGSSGTDGIYTIDPATATSTLVGNTGLGGSTPDIHFDQDGNLFGTKVGADYISINKVTGTGTIIGPVGFTAVIGLATRLESVSGISCDDIFFFNAKCNSNGAAQAMVKMVGDFSGETVTFDLDGENFVSSVLSNGTNSIAKMSIPHAGMGSHTVSLEIPVGCYSPVTFNCQVDAAADPEWDALWSESEPFTSQVSTNIPTETGIIGNYPNPFNPSTTLRYGLAEPGQVGLKVYNMLGQLVRTIVDEQQLEGYHEAVWDGRNEGGAIMASGVYIYRMTAGSFVETKRMLLIK